MDKGLPYRRRQARAIAISETFDAQRRAAITKVMLVLASMAVVFEALSLAQNMWGVSHP